LANTNNIAIDKSYLTGATSKQLGSYVDLLSFSIFTGGNDSIEEGFEEIFSTVTEKQKEQILAMMETVDWTREGSAENFIEDLKTLGIIFDESNPKIEAFIKQLDLANSVFRDFDLNSILNQTKEELEEISEIAGQKELTTE
jgi:hypothetical protein